jgi:hypothetical protein
MSCIHDLNFDIAESYNLLRRSVEKTRESLDVRSGVPMQDAAERLMVELKVLRNKRNEWINHKAKLKTVREILGAHEGESVSDCAKRLDRKMGVLYDKSKACRAAVNAERGETLIEACHRMRRLNDSLTDSVINLRLIKEEPGELRYLREEIIASLGCDKGDCIGAIQKAGRLIRRVRDLVRVYV